MKAAMVGGVGLLLALVVGLSIWVGKLRGEVRDGEKLLAAVTQQRDAAVARSRDHLEEALAADTEAAKHKKLAADARAERDAVELLLADSRGLLEAAKSKRPTTFVECMKGLKTVEQHSALLTDALKLQSKELRFTKESLAAREYQVVQLEASVAALDEALRLEGERVEAGRLVSKQRRKKRIVGFTLGALVIAGGALAGGVALGKR